MGAPRTRNNANELARAWAHQLLAAGGARRLKRKARESSHSRVNRDIRNGAGKSAAVTRRFGVPLQNQAV
jgi:hypothetical protein